MIFKQKWMGRIYDKDVENQWFEANVPGNIQYDYGVANKFGDPDYMDNYLKYQPLEDLTWEYKTKLSFDRSEGESVWFVSLGIDYIYDVLLNGVDRHGIKAWGYDTWVCQPILEHYFGKANSLEQLIEWSETLQSIGYQSAFETMRQQWPHCSMMLNWCYNEPWSNAANNCIMSYPARPKKSYYAVKNALRPTMFSAGIDRYDWKEGELFSADIWLLNDRPEKVNGSVTVELVTAEQTMKLIEWVAEADANSNMQGPTVHVTLPMSAEDFFTLRLKADNGMENEYKLLLRHRLRKVEKIKTMNQ